MEGSRNGEDWLAYEFRYKPGSDLARPPPVVAPHQPRLDWQLWFAALGTYGTSPYFVHLAAKLLVGEPDVLALLDTERLPFPPGRPPRWVRATLYVYDFAPRDRRLGQGQWWTRRRVAEYFPPVDLANGSLRDAVRRFGWGELPSEPIREPELRSPDGPPLAATLALGAVFAVIEGALDAAHREDMRQPPPPTTHEKAE